MTASQPSRTTRQPRDPAMRLAVRESFVLPAAFLSVALAGGFRAAPEGGFHFVPPPLVHLVLAVLALAVLVRSGAFVPERLMNAARTPVENACGFAVIVTLFAATAQSLNAVTPESGVLQFVFVVFFVLLFWNTLAVQPDAMRARRSLLLVFGAALVFRHVVVEALYSPDASLTKRVLTTLLEGATLGGLHYTPTAPVTGYVAFFGLVLYFAAVLLLPTSPADSALDRPRPAAAIHPSSELPD
jgi:hypothetical protein